MGDLKVSFPARAALQIHIAHTPFGLSRSDRNQKPITLFGHLWSNDWGRRMDEQLSV